VNRSDPSNEGHSDREALSSRPLDREVCVPRRKTIHVAAWVGVAWAEKAGGWWRRLSGVYRFPDPGYEVVRRAAATFLTLSRVFAG
jgi:hypothetical protein